jgi:probable non-F420 flavinoid oxidoreductase
MTTTIGFHCSHEQHAPSALLRLARRAEEAGFADAMCSDHFAPWTTAQGHAGYTWSWLGSALESTAMSFGTVCAPGQRYHPAIVAQAVSTLCDMYPGRFWVAVGSGEAINEAITGDAWPPKAERQQRLAECVAIMRALWAGETVVHDGRVHVRHARLYSRAATPPLLIAAAISPQTAAWAASWADGLITVAGRRDRLRDVVDAYRDRGGRGPLCVQVPICWGGTDADNRRIAQAHWAQAALSPALLEDLDSPEHFDRAVRAVDEDSIAAAVRTAADVDRQMAWLQDDLRMGFTRIYLHNVNPDHDRFFAEFVPRALTLASA